MVGTDLGSTTGSFGASIYISALVNGSTTIGSGVFSASKVGATTSGFGASIYRPGLVTTSSLASSLAADIVSIKGTCFGVIIVLIIFAVSS